MRKVYIGIDAHKESNALALAFAGREAPVFHGNVSTDLSRTVDAFRKIQKQYGLEGGAPTANREARITTFAREVANDSG